MYLCFSEISFLIRKVCFVIQKGHRFIADESLGINFNTMAYS